MNGVREQNNHLVTVHAKNPPAGYQRQLNYKNADGAYSTFGQGLGNTWRVLGLFFTYG